MHTYIHTHIHRIDGKFARMTVGCVTSHKHTKYTKYSRDTFITVGINALQIYTVLWIIL